MINILNRKFLRNSYFFLIQLLIRNTTKMAFNIHNIGS